MSRKLCRQRLREYIEYLAMLSSASRSGHAFAPSLVAAARRCVIQAERLIEKSTWSRWSSRRYAHLARLFLFSNSFLLQPICNGGKVAYLADYRYLAKSQFMPT